MGMEVYDQRPKTASRRVARITVLRFFRASVVKRNSRLFVAALPEAVIGRSLQVAEKKKGVRRPRS